MTSHKQVIEVYISLEGSDQERAEFKAMLKREGWELKPDSKTLDFESFVAFKIQTKEEHDNDPS